MHRIYCMRLLQKPTEYMYSSYSYPYLTDTRQTFVRAECCASTEGELKYEKKRPPPSRVKYKILEIEFALHVAPSPPSLPHGQKGRGIGGSVESQTRVCDKKNTHTEHRAHDNVERICIFGGKGGLVSYCPLKKMRADKNQVECLYFLRLSNRLSPATYLSIFLPVAGIYSRNFCLQQTQSPLLRRLVV